MHYLELIRILPRYYVRVMDNVLSLTLSLTVSKLAHYRGYAQGVASRDYLIFSVIYRVSSWNEWLRAGALYGNLTRDAVLAFLGQICVLVQQTD